MTNEDSGNGPFGPMSRRSAIGSLLAGAAFATPGALTAETAPQASQTAPPRTRYDMKKSINLWAFPYPRADDARAVPAAREGRGLRRHRAELRSRQRPLAEVRDRRSSRRSATTADKIGIAISGLCSFLFWPYPLTSNDPAKRGRGAGAGRQDAAGRRTTSAPRTCSSCPAPCTFPWRTDHEPVPNDVCDQPGPRGRRQAGAAGGEAEGVT